jgi:hypothetical protein
MNLSHSRIAARGSLLFAGACLQWAAMAAESSAGVWRCGNSYSDRPCVGGSLLDAGDPRTEQQRREADRIAREARALAENMERERLLLEASAEGPALIADPRSAEAPAPRADKSRASSRGIAAKEPKFLVQQDPSARAGKARNRSPKKAR